jgi:sugar (pentulose or hexulose) kinase
VLIDGGLAHNAAFSGLVAAARPGRRVRVNTDPEGTAMGAAALAFAAAGRPGVVAVDLAEVRPAEIAGWPAYRDAWRARVGAPGG